jgi:protein-S-isoprenylcysteine O-methyltransferase Ste14
VSAATKQPETDRTPVSEEKTSPRETREAPTVWQRATYRWTAITAVMAVLLVLYTQHPYYLNAQFAPWRSVYPVAFVLWLAFGLFYVKATLEKFHERRYVVRDGALHLLMLAKVGFKDVLSKTEWTLVSLFAGAAALIGAARSLHLKAPLFAYLTDLARTSVASVVLFACAALGVILTVRCLQPRALWRKIKNPRVRTTLLGICVKGFFTPLMTGFVVGHINSLSRAWLAHHHLAPLDFKPPAGTSALGQISLWWHQVGSRLGDFIPTGADLSGFVAFGSWTRPDVEWGLGLAYDLVFMIDCGWALAGYASESRWLGNKTRSVEPTALGWVVCIFCYPPYNNVLGTYLPLESGPATITSPNVLLGFRAATVFLFAIYASATVAFGWKFSNLTNRGIVSRGPYRFVRHPAYLCKCSAWWLEHIPTITLVKAFFLTLLCGVYALRAWTEERHLSRDPDYVAYKKKTPWVLFPGVY